jgi:hypothetical protein
MPSGRPKGTKNKASHSAGGARASSGRKKRIMHLHPFLKQLQQSNLVNYSSKLLQHVNKFKNSRV